MRSCLCAGHHAPPYERGRQRCRRAAGGVQARWPRGGRSAAIPRCSTPM